MRAGLAVAVGLWMVSGGVVHGGQDPVPCPEVPRDGALSGLNVRLAWYDVSGQATAVFDDVAHELSTIFGHAGITLEWHHGRPGGDAVEAAALESTREVDLNVVVVETSPGLPQRAMGAAHHSQPPPHTVHVFLRNVREALGFDTRRDAVLRPSQRVELGRAIGRVIAHEIVHAYAPAHGHEHQGLMRAQLDAEFLKRDGVRLEEPSVRAVLDGLAGGSRGTAVLAPAE